MRSLFLLLALAFGLWAQPANPLNQNDIVLHNGSDGFFTFSSPSVGFATGSFPPNLVGDWYWRIFPRQALYAGVGAPGAGAGTIEISSFTLEVYDTNWATSPDFDDITFSQSMPSPVTPGHLEPDFLDPNLVFLSIGASGLPNPCVVQPSQCFRGCPTGGGVFSWQVDIEIGTGIGDGLIIPADGQIDLAMALFLKGGMTTMGGPCGGGDYSASSFYSSSVFPPAGPNNRGEAQADVLGNGLSPYSGFHLGTLNGMPSGIVVDPRDTVPAISIGLVTPTLTPIVDLGDGFWDRGLVTLAIPTSGGNTRLAFESYSWQTGTGALVVAGALAGLAPPGNQGLLLDVADPLFAFTLGLNIVAPYVYVPDPVAPNVRNGDNNYIAQTLPIPLPPVTGALELVFQGAAVGTSLELTNAFRFSIVP